MTWRAISARPIARLVIQRICEPRSLRLIASSILRRGKRNLKRQQVKLSVGVTCHPYLLEIEGLFTQGWRPGRTVGESVGGIFEMDSSDWSNGIRYHTFDTRPNTEFKRGLPVDASIGLPLGV